MKRNSTGRSKPISSGSRIPAALLQLAHLPQMTITLHDDRLPAGAPPTAVLLDAALQIITGGRAQPGDRRLHHWLFGVAVRAVAEAIVEQRHVWFPMIAVVEKGTRRKSEPFLGFVPLLRRRARTKVQAPTHPLRLGLNLQESSGEADELPLIEVLDAAFHVFDPGFYASGGWRRQRWFFRQALRAVCEAVLEAGELPPQPLIRLLRHHEKKQQSAAKPKVRALAPARQPANSSPGR